MNVATDGIATLGSWLSPEQRDATPDLQTCPRCSSQMLTFAGGSGCSACPAWIPHRRAQEEHVEKHPARPIDLADAVQRIRASLSVEHLDEAPTGLLPALPAGPSRTLADMDYATPPTETSQEIDLLTRITVAMLPVVRDGVPLTQLLAVARQIAALR